MIRFLAASVTIAVISAIFAGSARADTCHFETHTTIVSGVVVPQTIEVCPGQDVDAPVVEDGSVPPRDSDLDAICVATAISAGQDPFVFCDIPPGAAPSLITPDLIAEALKRIPLPPSELEVQPPNGRTLVNFDTNYFADSQVVDRGVTLLGQRVDLHIVPTQFGWHFGDGQSLSTEEPGSPYPQLDITHRYLKKGQVAPSVDTTYTATFRVNGGPWRDVPGSVTIPGAPVQLEVLTATPTLVGYDS